MGYHSGQEAADDFFNLLNPFFYIDTAWEIFFGYKFEDYFVENE